MRLLKTDTLELQDFIDGAILPYAILSHTWGDEEVSLQEMQGDREAIAHKKGFAKIDMCCEFSKRNGFDLVWIDTCCIDKTSSVELSEAINSMYRWYQEAEVCFAYLADVSGDTSGRPASREFSESRWFTRGWTLQELIAPTEVVFLSRDWGRIGTRSSLQHRISEITNIPTRILSGDDELETASIAQRMSWAATRKTSRVEDRAYCLMGMFGINMPLLYGEGENAFVRLQEEIVKVSDDYSIFAWSCENQGHGGLLATSPDAFKGSADVVLASHHHYTSLHNPLTMSNRGITLELSFMGIGPRQLGIALLPCNRIGKGDMLIAIHMRDISTTMEDIERICPGILELIDLARFRPCQYPTRRVCVRQRRLAPAKISKVRQKQKPRLGGTEEFTSVDDAAHSPHWNLFQQLEAQANWKGQQDRTSLSLTAARGSVEALWLLLAQRNVIVNSRDEYGKTPLSYAAGAGQNEVVWLLLTRSDVATDIPDNSGRTPLSYAAAAGHEAVVKMILAQGSNSANQEDNERRSPLSYASESGNETVVKMLVARARNDAELNAADYHGRTPLWWAITGGYCNIVKLLLDYGADIDARSHREEGQTPLIHAIELHQEAITKLLLENGANIESRGDRGRTPLMDAARVGTKATVELLLENGAYIESKSSRGRTPLAYAAKWGREAVVRLLLEKGANANADDGNGETPWRLVEKYEYKPGNKAVMKVLDAHRTRNLG
jgi:ankyrin repeat protein